MTNGATELTQFAVDHFKLAVVERRPASTVLFGTQ